jgi:Ca2+-binding RTX toxin-like protein
VTPTIRTALVLVPVLAGVLLAPSGGTTAPAGPAAAGCMGLATTISGTAADEIITGTPGNDVVDAMQGNDVVDGLGGNDIICGGDGDDVLRGGPGNDDVSGDGGNDTLDGGAGADWAFYDVAPGPITASLATGTGVGWGTDMLVAVEGLVGSRFADVLTGNDRDNHLDGRGGNDVLRALGGRSDFLDGDAGNDVLNGGAGGDTAVYEYAPRRITANLSTGRAFGWGRDRFVAVEDVNGSAYGDTLIGTSRHNWLIGYGGDDTILALGGPDILWGVSGRDRLDGGRGFDRINGGAGVDRCINGERLSRCP